MSSHLNHAHDVKERVENYEILLFASKGSFCVFQSSLWKFTSWFIVLIIKPDNI